MAALTYTISSNDLDRWANRQLIQSNLVVEGTKRLVIALDALVDRTVVNPEQAYQISNS
jgi:hypothetical protein